MDDSGFSFFPSTFVFGSLPESVTGTQINSGSPFRFLGNNDGCSEAHNRERPRFYKARKVARSASSIISTTNSVDPLSSKSTTTQNCFTCGRVSSFSTTINHSVNSGLELDDEKLQVQRQEIIKPGVTKIETNRASKDAKNTAEAASEPEQESIKPVVTKTETNCAKEMDVLPPIDSKQDTVAREANQEPIATTSLIKISRILKGIPQSPHFYHLRNLSHHARNILIHSWDRIFEETVEQIHYLRVDDFWVRGRELWKTMGELQNMGYNVIPLRKRLLELSDVMMELKLTKLEIKHLMIKAENHRIQKSRLEFMILNLQEMIRKEHHGIVGALSEMAEMEKEVPKFDNVFAKLAMEPL